MKKGFTLIELLAVIVILAIIALIATPMILGVIENAKKGAVESSAFGYVEAIEKQNLNDTINHGIQIADGIYDAPMENILLKGEPPKSGWFIIEKGEVTNYSFVINGYIVTKGKRTLKGTTAEEKPTTLPKGLIAGTPVYVNPEIKTVCNESNAVSTVGTKTGCMKWYVYKDNNDGTYQLILDHNTTALVAWNKSNDPNIGMKEIDETLINDTKSWDKSLNARLITADEIAKITNNTTFDQTTTTVDNWFYFDSNNQTQIANSTIKSNYAWLYDNTNCADYGCNFVDTSTFGYWTNSLIFGYDNRVWVVRRGGNLYYNYANNEIYFGLRPVIKF